mgnify:CR=1 FL=1
MCSPRCGSRSRGRCHATNADPDRPGGAAALVALEFAELDRPARALAGALAALGYVLLAGFGVGAALLGSWWVSGVAGLVPEHPQTLETVFLTTSSGRMEGLSFTGPVAQWLDAFMYTADGGKRITFGMVLVPGVVLGAAWAAWRQGSFRWEGFSQTADLARHLVGAALMGIGGVSAMGCTFGQGLTGLSTLNWGSLVAVAAMVLGAVLALRVQWWLAERHG